MTGEIGIFLALLALIGWGSYPVFMKRVIDRLGEYTCMLFNHGVLVVLLLLTAVFTIRFRIPSDFVMSAIIIGSIVGAVAVYLYYKAINIGKVSVVTVITALKVLWVVAVSYFLFDERLVLDKYIAIGVILLGTIMAALQRPGLPKKFTQEYFIPFLKSDIWSKGAGLAVVVSFCWALFYLAAKYSVSSIGAHRTTVYMESLVLLFILFAFLARPAKKLVVIPNKKQLKWIGLSAILFSIGAVCFYFAMKYIPVSLVTPIVSAAPAVTAVAALVILKERLKVHQYIGIVLAVAGIVVLSL
jgi:drug/metabolite transporter (DMT)-like permease